MRMPIRSQPTAPDWSRMSSLFMCAGIPERPTSKPGVRLKPDPTRFVALVSLVAWFTALAPVTASAHLSAEPAFLAVGSKQRIVLTVHNDRDATMTGFRLTVPKGFRIHGTGGDESWNEAVGGAGATATWTGGSLAAFRPTTFEVDVEA